MSNQDDVLTLLDEEGGEHNFEVIDILKVNKHEYAILLPMEAEEGGDLDVEEGEAIIFRIVDEGDENQTLMAVEDEEEWKQVASAWEEKARDEIEDETHLEDEEEDL